MTCQVWLHTTCMPDTRIGRDISWDQDPMEVWDDSDNTRVWLEVRKVAYERAPRVGHGYTDHPYTLEGVLKVLSDYLDLVAVIIPGGVAKPLPDFDKKLHSVVRDLVNDSSIIPQVVDEVRAAMDLADSNVYYKCLRCRRYI